MRYLSVAMAVVMSILAGNAVGEDFANHLVIHNKGVSGQNSREGLARFETDVVALRPQFVLIYFGINDTLFEPKFLDPTEYVDNMRKMIVTARAAGIVPVLATIHHVDVEALMKRHKKEAYGEEGPQKKIDRYNALLRRLAEEQKVQMLDWCMILDRAMAAAEAAKDGVVYRHADGVHLTPAGNRLLAGSFHGLIANGLRDGQVIVCIGDSVTFGERNKGAGTAVGETYPAYLRRIEIK